MRLLLIGFGRMGRFYLDLLERDARIQDVLVHSSSMHVTGLSGSNFKTSFVTRLEAIAALEQGNVNGVLVVTSTPAHSYWVRVAIQTGTPCFVEKPMTNDLASAKALVKEIEAAQAVVGVAFQRRFDPEMCWIRSQIQTKALGTLVSLESCTRDPSPPSRKYLETSGGIFLDCAIHDIDTLSWLTDSSPTVLFANGRRQSALYDGIEDSDSATAVLDYGDGIIGVIQVTRFNGAGYDVRLQAHGEADTAVSGIDVRSPLPKREGRPSRPYRDFLERFEEAYELELGNFLNYLSGTESLKMCSPREALAAQEIAEKCTNALNRSTRGSGDVPNNKL